MPDDRRGLERRVEVLERQARDLQQTMQRVELEQVHVREVIDSRFRALDKGQEMLLLKFEAIATMLSQMSGDPQASPMGRVLAERIDVARNETEKRVHDLEEQCSADRRKVTELQEGVDQVKGTANQIEGAMWPLKVTGVTAVILALASIVVALVRAGMAHL